MGFSIERDLGLSKPLRASFLQAATSKYIQRYVPTREERRKTTSAIKDRKPTDLSAQAKKPVKAARGMLRGDTTQSTGKGTKNRFEVEGVVLRYTTHNGWATMDGQQWMERKARQRVSKQASITLAQALSRPLPGKKKPNSTPSRIRLLSRNGQREKSRLHKSVTMQRPPSGLLSPSISRNEKDSNMPRKRKGIKTPAPFFARAEFPN